MSDRNPVTVGTTLFLPCAAGVESYLLAEVQGILPSSRPDAVRGGVAVRGGMHDAMSLNLRSRLAQRVLWQVAQGRYGDEHDLYDLARQVPWPKWITPQQTLRIDVTAQRSPLTSLNFAVLRIKDAVCDVMRDATGERPSVDTRSPDLALVLHLTPDTATLYVDTSGVPLFKRGWREDTGEAPLKETLAAAMLAAAGWQGRAEDGPLLDPCCGAGTIAIEAAQLACGIVPGLHRRFAFERLQPFRPLQAEWRALQAAARAQVHAPRVPVYAGDVAFRMTDFALRNAERAGVKHAIEFKTADALQRPAPDITPWGKGTLMFNPPYGERIGVKGLAATGAGRSAAGNARGGPVGREGFESGAAAEFFGGLASHWKRQYAGWSAWILTPDMKLPSLLRFKESRRVPMWNGPIECRLFRFDLVAGSARRAPVEPPAAGA